MGSRMARNSGFQPKTSVRRTPLLTCSWWWPCKSEELVWSAIHQNNETLNPSFGWNPWEKVRKWENQYLFGHSWKWRRLHLFITLSFSFFTFLPCINFITGYWALPYVLVLQDFTIHGIKYLPHKLKYLPYNKMRWHLKLLVWYLVLSKCSVNGTNYYS